jgi:hypothetical protein
MLTCNLWVEVVLVNGSLGYIQNIFYMSSSKPPHLPMYTNFIFDNYIGVPFDPINPNIVPITLVIR